MSFHGESILLTEENLTRLVRNGFNPVPVLRASKHPGIKDWRRFCWEQPDVNIIANWARDHNGSSIGCACGRSVTVVDIDCGDETLTNQAMAQAQLHLGSTPLVRYGRKYRAALIYQCAEPTLSAGYGEVDILGLGAQFVAFGLHPRTRSPYVWKGKKNPLNTPIDSLPAIDNRQIDTFLASIAALQEPGIEQTRRLQIDNIILLAPLSSITVLLRMLLTRARRGRRYAQQKARSIIDKKYYDTGCGLKVQWMKDGTSKKKNEDQA